MSSESQSDLISIAVTTSSKGGDRTVAVKNIPLSITVGELKTKLTVAETSRLGRLHEFENWDNRRPLSDYFVKDQENLGCVLQCSVEDGQSSYDDYDLWLAKSQSKINE
ncbi:unnamed protein product [Didymodactylos carnosus]|uniref:Ubiquitin-like domain-containing protein n=1 Tax=Didymodactylos carnosus TaxID=1234261 RepID=A0A814RN75_9BILA|nr:unnamed protein product [Didymodactylos carnosus]CAF3899962.1 unnamed protein product [Didymodactylos carnosus]